MADEGELEGLLSKARAGDRDCLVSLLDHLGAEVRRRIEPKISPRQRSSLDADDVMQVTYLEAVLQFGGFRDGGVSALRAWLTRLAQNNLIDAIRPRGRQTLQPLAAGVGRAGAGLGPGAGGTARRDVHHAEPCCGQA